MTTLRQRLKDETANAHRALDGLPALAQLAAPGLTRDQYARVLGVFYAFYASMEAQRDASGMPGFSGETRPLPSLARDLALLGVDCHGIAPLDLPPAITDEASALGYLYVKQGATLGGQFLAGRIADSLGLEPGEGQFFFHGAGPKATGAAWKAFEEHLLAWQDRVAAEKVVGAARKCFSLLGRALTMRA